jgi:Immunity protein 26
VHTRSACEGGPPRTCASSPPEGEPILGALQREPAFQVWRKGETEIPVKRQRPKVGDVFTMPLDDERVAYGQVVAKEGSEFAFVAFDGTGPPGGDLDVEAIAAQPILFFLSSADAELWRGRWKIIGNAPVDAAVPWPAYLEPTGNGGFDVVDYHGTRRRPATTDEAEALWLRTHTSPLTLEEAVKTHHGLEPKGTFHESAELPPVHLRAAAIFGHLAEGAPERDAEEGPEPYVVTHLPLSSAPYGTDDEREAIAALEERIQAAVAPIGGDHDGHEIGGGHVRLFTYGPDHDAVLDAIRAALGDFPVRPGAYAEKRSPRRERVELA